MTPDTYQQLVNKIVEAVPEIKTTWYEYSCSKLFCHKKCPPEVEKSETRPIQLADVLLALQKAGELTRESETLGWLFYDGLSPNRKWDLSKDLSQQSDETKMFLYNLIAKT